jgi:hypothetical protein
MYIIQGGVSKRTTTNAVASAGITANQVIYTTPGGTLTNVGATLNMMIGTGQQPGLALKAANNLSDIGSATAARTNLVVPGLSTTNAFPLTQTFSVAPIFSDPAGTRSALSVAPTVANNTELATLFTTTVPSVYRSGFATAGDSPTTFYKGASLCPYNGGVADGWGCVASANGEFWVNTVVDQTANNFIIGAQELNGNGTILSAQNPSWPAFTPTRNGNPIQVSGIPSAYSGYGSVVMSGNVVTITYGYFSAADIIAGDWITVNGVTLQVVSTTSSGGNVLTITVKNTDGTAYTFPATNSHVFVSESYEYAQFIGNVRGTAVTRVSGDFVNTSGCAQIPVIINGTTYAQSGSAPDYSHLTLTSSAGTISNASITQKCFAAYLSMYKWQSVNGSTEANIAAYTDVYGQWQLHATSTSSVDQMRLLMGTGIDGGSNFYNQLVLETNGTTRVGGIAGIETLEIQNSANAASNRLIVTPGTSGGSPKIAAAGNSTNVGIDFTMQGIGGFSFAGAGTSHRDTSAIATIVSSSAINAALSFWDINTGGKTWEFGPGVDTGSPTQFNIYDKTDNALLASLSTSGVLTLLSGGSINIGASGGVSCSGAPTGSFASVGGVVTHC